jgi:uncharacterized protein (TIGR04255 family)
MSGPKYPNQQLRAVSLEAYFPGQFSVLAGLASVQALVRSELPNLFVPNVEPGQAPALRPFQLRNVENSESLAFAINQASYVSFRYPGFDAMKARAVPLLRDALGKLDVEKLNRVTYRYENEIGIGRDERAALPLDRILKLDLPVWCGSQFTKLNLDSQWLWDGGQVAVSVHVDGPIGAEILKFSIAASMTANVGPVSSLGRYADAVHNEANRIFETMITDDFREYIRAGGQDE